MGKRVVATKSGLDYTWVSMVAEIGGYVGLLLGFAVVDIVFAIDRVWPKIYSQGKGKGKSTKVKVAPAPAN